MTVTVDPSPLVQGVLDRELRAIARLITRAESADPQWAGDFADIYRHTGAAHVVGITGVPGSGKSTLVRELALAARRAARRVGVIAVDPTSPYSGGAILGDRIRMAALTRDPDIFIRSMATRGELGGLARASLDAVDVLDAAGFDLVFVETVGVGQDEVDVVRATHTTVVVSAPGLGDEVQAIKAGVLEIADIHVVSKCDRPDAGKTVTELRAMLSLGVDRARTHAGTGGWKARVIATSAETGEGVAELLAQIDAHHAWLGDSGRMAIRRRRIAEMRMLKTAEDILRQRFERSRDRYMQELVDRLAERTIDPHAAGHELIARLGGEATDSSGA